MRRAPLHLAGDLTRLRPPALCCPFPGGVSPYREQVESENLAWLRRLGLIANGQADKRLRTARFGDLAARAYPEASLEGLTVAAGWASWLFLRDDLCDEQGIGSDPEALRAASGVQLGVLAGSRPPADALSCALADLRRRMIQLADEGWLARFLLNVHDYFEASVWEASNRRAGTVPDTHTYLRMRDLTGAVKTCFDIHELADGACLPVEARCEPILVRMMQLANRVICWSNDLFSVAKEARAGDFHNLVLVLMHNESLELADAMRGAARMHDAALKAFTRLEARLESRGITPEVREFVAGLKCWMRANLDWSRETGRYAGCEPGGDLDPQCREA